MKKIIIPAAAIIAFFCFNNGVAKMQTNQFTPETQELVDIILKSPGNISPEFRAEKGNINEVGKDGITPIIYAVIKLNEEAVKAMLQLNADPNVKQNNEYNALTAAYEVVHHNPKILDILIASRRCDLNVLMPDGEPMIYYLIAGELNVQLKNALSNGARPTLKTRSGRELVIAAAILEAYEAVELLLEAGASPLSTDLAGVSLEKILESGSIQHTSPDDPSNKVRLRILNRLTNI